MMCVGRAIVARAIVALSGWFIVFLVQVECLLLGLLSWTMIEQCPVGCVLLVYKGCNIDCKGADVNSDNFVEVMTGTASGKKLESTSEDNVFVSMMKSTILGQQFRVLIGLYWWQDPMDKAIIVTKLMFAILATMH